MTTGPGKAYEAITDRFFGLDLSTVESGGMPRPVALLHPTHFTITPAAGAANVCNVTIQMVDRQGTAIAACKIVELWLSDSSVGNGITATAASGTVTATTGTDLTDLLAKKVKKIMTNASGVIVLAITDTAKTGFYVVCASPIDNHRTVSAQLATGNYG